MGLLTSRVHAALLATLAVACATQLDESGVASDLEESTGATGGSSGSGTSGSTAKGGTTSTGKGGTTGTSGTGGSGGGGKAGSSAGGSSAGTGPTAGTAGSSAGTGGSSAGSSGTGGSGGSSGGGTGGSGGVVSNGDCDAPSDASKGTAKCGSTIIYMNALYTCISQASGVNGESSGCGTAGVYCNTIDPDDAAWGTIAWTKLDDC